MFILIHLVFILVYGYLLANDIRDGKTVQAVLSSAVVTINCMAVIHLALKR